MEDHRSKIENYRSKNKDQRSKIQATEEPPFISLPRVLCLVSRNPLAVGVLARQNKGEVINNRRGKQEAIDAIK